MAEVAVVSIAVIDSLFEDLAVVFSVSICSLAWNDEDQIHRLLAYYPDGFPIIVGSDLIYKLSTMDSLFETVDSVLSTSSSLSQSSVPSVFSASQLCPPLFILAFQPRFSEVTLRLKTVIDYYHFTMFRVVEGRSEESTSSSSTVIPINIAELRWLHGIPVEFVSDMDQFLPATDSHPCILLFIRSL